MSDSHKSLLIFYFVFGFTSSMFLDTQQVPSRRLVVVFQIYLANRCFNPEYLRMGSTKNLSGDG